jgi:hypothetical protein
MISFDSGITLLKIEDAYKKLQGAEVQDVRLPKNLNHGGSFGITSAIIQFIATWSKSPQAGKLLPYGTSVGKESFADLLHQPHGLLASYLAPHLADSKKNNLEKQDVLAQAVPYIEAMQSTQLRGTMNGRGAILACFAGAKNEFLLPLYERPNLQGMRGLGDFENLTKKLIGVCDPSIVKHLPDTFIQSLGLLVRELFENTNDHGSSDDFGQNYSWSHPNVRAISAKFISFNPNDKNVMETFDDVPHRLFFQKQMLSTSSEKQTNFIELSVIDCGVGIAKKWLSHIDPHKNINDVSIKEEERFVRETFELGKTSKQINGTGVGLYTVIKSLVLMKALLRLRTGRLCLYQDFSSGGGEVFEPTHWLKDRKELPRTVGTSFSILIPISIKRKL